MAYLSGARVLVPLAPYGPAFGVLRGQTVLEVVEYRKDGPEVVVQTGLGLISTGFAIFNRSPMKKVTLGSQRFAVSHRFLDEEEGAAVI